MWRFENKQALLLNPSWTLELDVESPDAGLGDLAIGGPCPEQAPVFQRFGAKLLQIQSPYQDSIGRPVCESAYVRGADLVATYRMSNSHEICWQVYWRELVAEENAIGGIELIVSVQTDLLDSDPRLYVGSHFAAVELLKIAPGTSQHACSVDIGSGCEETGRAPGRGDEDTASAEGRELPGQVSSPSRSIARPTFASLDPPGALLARPPQASFSYLELIHPADFSAVEVTGDGAEPPTFASRFHLFDDHLEKGVIRRARLRAVVLPRADDIAMATACYHSFLQSAIPLTA